MACTRELLASREYRTLGSRVAGVSRMSPVLSSRIPRRPASLPGDLWGLVAFFNPMQYANKLPHLRRFSERVRRQGLRLLIIEMAYDDSPFDVADDLADLVVRVRTDAVLWQRERLLNIGLAALPSSCDKVVWVDADLLFENDDWVAQTRALLEEFVVVQPFESACWLPRGAVDPVAVPGSTTKPGAAATMAAHDDWPKALSNYLAHGHTGFGWAFRRSVLDRHGYYDGLIVGGADVVMMHAIYGDDRFFAGHNWYSRRLTPGILRHAAEWSRGFLPDVGASVAYTPGTVMHLWHGDVEARRYVERLEMLRRADFDPESDIALNADGCWTWRSAKPDLHRQLREYFAARREDG